MSPMLRRPQPEKLNVCKAFWFGNAHIARQEDLDSKNAIKCMIENSSADLILDMAQTVNKSEVCWSKTGILSYNAKSSTASSNNQPEMTFPLDFG